MKSRTNRFDERRNSSKISLERPLLYTAPVANDENCGNDFFKANERQRARSGPAYDSR
jgi:hypothetical protein